MSFGIALPSWIVEKENSVWVLGLYALVFMVALPTAVSKINNYKILYVLNTLDIHDYDPTLDVPALWLNNQQMQIMQAFTSSMGIKQVKN